MNFVDLSICKRHTLCTGIVLFKGRVFIKAINKNMKNPSIKTEVKKKKQSKLLETLLAKVSLELKMPESLYATVL